MTPGIRQKGVALVLVLWVTVLLAIMAGAFTLTLQREAKLLGNLKSRSEANALAEAGLYYAMLMLSVKDVELGWKTDGSVHELAFNNGVVAVKVSDERGKIDLNFAGRNLLFNMFASVALDMDEADRLTDAILDWRDKNDEVHLNGAEKKDYQERNLPYAPRNGLFQSVDELRFVLGVTPRIFNAVEPMLTVYSRNSNVDKIKASDDVQRVLQRLEENAAGVSADDSAGRAEDVNEMHDATDTEPNDEGDDGDGNGSSGNDSGGGRIASIFAEAVLSNGQTARIRIVARPRSGNSPGFDILNWKFVTTQSNVLQSAPPVNDSGYF